MKAHWSDHHLFYAVLKPCSVFLSDLRARLTQAMIVGMYLWVCHCFQVNMQAKILFSIGDVIVDVVFQLEGNLEEVASGVQGVGFGLTSTTGVGRRLFVACGFVLVQRGQDLVRTLIVGGR